jgi:uncharacterized protein (TIGR00251 family)
MEVVEKDGSIVFSVRVVPRASRSEIIGEHDGALKIRISSAPVDGAANAELIRLFAKHFGVSKSDVSILNGETSKNKRIKIANVSVSKVRELIK